MWISCFIFALLLILKKDKMKKLLLLSLTTLCSLTMASQTKPNEPILSSEVINTITYKLPTNTQDEWYGINKYDLKKYTVKNVVEIKANSLYTERHKDRHTNTDYTSIKYCYVITLTDGTITMGFDNFSSLKKGDTLYGTRDIYFTEQEFNNLKK